MRIDKLYTLSQFVDMIQPMIQEKKANYEDYSCAWAVDRIYYYNEFLKQPLKKEMFINELKEPSRYHQFKHGKFLLLNKQNLRRCHEFEEAEKKVIFEPRSLNRSGDPKGFWTIHMIARKDTGTLFELAESFNIQLKLKNVEI